MHFLGVDLGTTNVKAAVADATGRFLGVGTRSVPLHHTGPGGVEQDLEHIWRATIEATREAARASGVHDVAALGVSSQGGALQLLDPNRHPSGPVISWLDDRGRAFDDALTAELGTGWCRQHLGHGRTGLAIGQLLRLRGEQPDLLDPPRSVGFVGDIIVGRLCGQPAHDATSCGLTLLLNPFSGGYDPPLLRRLGILDTQLPPIIPPRKAAGGLLAEVAAETGLPAGIPVSAAVHDQYAAALGTGTVQPGDVMFGAGTAWVLLVVTDALRPPVVDDAFICQHVVKGRFGQILSLRNGGSAVTWALALTGLNGIGGDRLDALLDSVPAGSEGLRCRPWLAGSGATETPPAAEGCLLGLRLHHTRAHVVRAVIEGLAFELGRHLGFLRRANLPAERLVMCGGAAGSGITPQIVADATGLPVACSPVGEGSLLGAVLLARALHEPARPFPDLVAEMVPVGRVVRPGHHAQLYQEGLQQYMGYLAGRLTL